MDGLWKCGEDGAERVNDDTECGARIFLLYQKICLRQA